MPFRSALRSANALELSTRCALEAHWLLFFGSESKNRIHDQRALHAHETAEAAVSTFQFLHDEPIRDVIHIRAAELFRKVSAEQAQLSHFGNQFLRKGRVFEMFVDD